MEMVKVHGMGGKSRKFSMQAEKTFQRGEGEFWGKPTKSRKAKAARGKPKEQKGLAKLPTIREPRLESQGFRKKEFFTQIQNCRLEFGRPETGRAFNARVWNGVLNGRISAIEGLFLRLSADSCTRRTYAQRKNGSEFKILEDEKRRKFQEILAGDFGLGFKMVEKFDGIFSACFNTAMLGIKFDLTS